jgi:hypothetical protein
MIKSDVIMKDLHRIKCWGGGVMILFHFKVCFFFMT